MRYLLPLLLAGLCAAPAEATEFYVAKTGSDANSCAAAQNISTPKLTLLSVLGCESAGDTIWVGDGTYTDTSIGGSITAGTSASNMTAIRAINSRQAILRPTSSSTGGQAVVLSAKPFVWLDGIVIDAGALTNDALKLDSGSTGIKLTNVELKNSKTQGLLASRTSTGGTMTGSYLHHNGDHAVTPNLWHGAYIQASGWVIERNEFAFNAQMGMQIYRSGGGDPSNVISRRNYYHDNCQGSHTGANLVLSYQNNLSEYDVVSLGDECTTGISVINSSPLNNTIRHASIYCSDGSCSNGVSINSAATSTIVQNSVILGGFTSPINDGGTGSTLTDNVTSGTATTYWTSPSTGDFTLKAGSPAIDAGTNISLSYNNTFPDQGAHESPVFSACEVRNGAESVVRVTFINNLRPPMLPASSVTGVTFRKNGSNNAVISSLRVGDNQYDFTITNAHVGGDPVDMSIVPASTNLTDSALIGNTSNQPFVSTLTNQSCTNNAGAPSTAVITQTKFRVHGLYGAEATPLIKAITNTNYSVVVGGAHRLRLKIAGTVADPEPTGFQLRVSHNSGAYVVLTDAYVNHVKMYATSHVDIPDGSATTELLASDYATNVAGSIVSYSHAVPNVDLSTDSECELEYVIQYENTAVVGDTYDYRLYTNAGDALTAYTVTPRVTINPTQATGGY